MAKTYQDIQNELGVNEGNSIVELIAKMNDYNVVSPSEITKIISVSVDRLENQVTGKAKEVKRRMYEPVTDDTKGIVSVLNKRIVLLDMIINKLKLEALDILNQHRTNYSNPHKVTKTQVGLNNVDNTSDLDKPISKATQTALNEISSNLDTHKNNTSNPHNVTKAQVGLTNVLDKEQLGKQEKAVDSDKLNGQKADYYAVKNNVENEAAYDLDFTMDSSNYVLTVYLKNKSGVVLTQKSIDLPLETMVIGGRYDNETKKIILTLRGVDNPIEFSVADLISGLQGEINENNKLRVELIDGLTKTYLGLEKVINKGMDDKPTANSDNYVKSGGVYSELNKKIDKSQGADNANKVFMTDSSGNLILAKRIPSNSLPATGVSVDTAKQLEKTDGTKIGADEVALKKDFNNVDNTSDMDKPISTAQQQALDLKANKSDVSEVDIDLESTGTIVSIPENAKGYGTIEKLGGKSYKSENLLVLEDVAETTTNGITYSIKNGVITLNGTATYDTNVWLDLSNTIQTQNVYVYFDIKNSGSDNVYTSWIWLAETNPNYSNRFQANNGAKTLTYSLSAIDIYISVDKSIDAKIYPMLVSGSTAPTEFSQGFEGIKIEYPTNVKVVGRNLAYDTQYNNGSIPKYNWLCKGSLYLPKGTYTISLNTNNFIGGAWLYLNEKYFNDETIDGNNYLINESVGNLITKKINVIKPIILINDTIIKTTYSTTYSVSDLMLNYGDTALPYAPYTEQNLPQTSIINYVSTQLQTNHSWTQENASKWLGLGVSDSNIINYANKKAIVKYSIVDMGTLSFTYNSSANTFTTNINDIKQTTTNNQMPNILTTKFNPIVWSGGVWVDGSTCGMLANQSIIHFYDTSYGTDATAFKNAMQGVYLIYELATPIEIDLSSIETEEHFECEPNGSIYHDSLANYKYSFPVSLKGQVELNFEHDKEQQRDIDSLKKEIDLKANKSETYTKEETNELLNDKVDKISGKGLSTNDFTNELKSKLDSLSNYDDTTIQNEIASIKERLDWIERNLVIEKIQTVSGNATKLGSDGKYYYSGSFTVDGTIKSAEVIALVGSRIEMNHSENIISYTIYSSTEGTLVSANIKYTYAKQGL